ncbi:MAG: DUF1653 domain-containing protein [Candidatus Woesearchaeota archaeon]
MMDEVRPGIYQHYKGKEYEVVGVAKHSETLEELVIYKALYNTEEFPFGQLWVRPYKMFLEILEIDGKETPRFNKVE